MAWDWQTTSLAIAIVLWGAAQYALTIYSLRDLARRPRVRGDNKVVWALVILTLPFIGALIYASIGPTSFLPRAGRANAGIRPAVAEPAGDSAALQPPPLRGGTPPVVRERLIGIGSRLDNWVGKLDGRRRSLGPRRD